MRITGWGFFLNHTYSPDTVISHPHPTAQVKMPQRAYILMLQVGNCHPPHQKRREETIFLKATTVRTRMVKSQLVTVHQSSEFRNASGLPGRCSAAVLNLSLCHHLRSPHFPGGCSWSQAPFLTLFCNPSPAT